MHEIVAWIDPELLDKGRRLRPWFDAGRRCWNRKPGLSRGKPGPPRGREVKRSGEVEANNDDSADDDISPVDDEDDVGNRTEENPRSF